LAQGVGIVIYPWWNGSNGDTRSQGAGLFDGKYNTELINLTQGGTNTPASFCDNLTHGGFNDWYLPSIGELNLIWEHLVDSNNDGSSHGADFWNLTDLLATAYWSSTGHVSIAWALDFAIGTPFTADKSDGHILCAVRSF
jgi:hypothetical protein